MKKYISDCFVVLVLSFIFSLGALFAFEANAESFISSEIKTGSYTVPNGKIAILKPLSGDITLNSGHLGVTINTSMSSAATATHFINTGEGFHCFSSSGGTLVSNSVQLLSSVSVNNSGAAVNPAGFTVLYSGNSHLNNICTSSSSVSYTAAYSGTVTLTIKSIKHKEFKIKSGDVVSGTRYLIELYER